MVYDIQAPGIQTIKVIVINHFIFKKPVGRISKYAAPWLFFTVLIFFQGCEEVKEGEDTNFNMPGNGQLNEDAAGDSAEAKPMDYAQALLDSLMREDITDTGCTEKVYQLPDSIIHHHRPADSILKVLRMGKYEYTDIYNYYLKVDEEIHGLLVMRIFLLPNGIVNEAFILTNQTGNTKMEEDLIGYTKTLRFMKVRTLHPDVYNIKMWFSKSAGVLL